MPTYNRPGLNALRYRVGTHGTFFETMKARLAAMEVQAPGKDGQTIESFLPLTGLTTRDSGDPAIALLDSWATVADVLTFYEERIANEGYLRTATERRSVLELARLVGYALRPGVASTVYLAYTLDDKQADPVEIPIGSRSQSIPGPDELPQSFETSEKIIARSEWNNLQVRLTRPQNITFANALAIDRIYVSGSSTNLKTGDSLLLVFGDDGKPSVVRKVAKAVGQFIDNRTEIQLQPVPVAVAAGFPVLTDFVAVTKTLVTAPQSAARRVVDAADAIHTQTGLGMPSDPAQWAKRILEAADGVALNHPDLEKAHSDFDAAMKDTLSKLPSGPVGPTVTDPSKFVTPLLKPPIAQAASSLRLGRSLKQSADRRADIHPQLLVNFAPQLKRTFYTALENANVNAAAPALKAVYVLRMETQLFGATVSKIPTFTNGKLDPPSSWTDWGLEQDERSNALFLDQAHEEILPASYVLIHKKEPGSDLQRRVFRVFGADTSSRTAYGISGKTTRLAFADNWWFGVQDSMATLRSTIVFGQSEELTLIEEPVTTDVQGQEIELGALYKELTSGRWVIFSGERADIPGVAGVNASELLMVSGLRHDHDPNLPGDKTHTTLLLATRTAYVYKRGTLTIHGNVIKATHGETRNETLGNGDGSQPLQSFVLKQPPLTFVPAPTAAGVESTLKIYVNDVEWHEADTLAGAGPKDRVFITKTDDDSKTTVIFGNGKEGSRLPTGVLNVRSVYRNGIGRPGNVLAGQISLLQSRPLGVKSVINPLRASGGADKENRDQARDNAPLAVMALDRLVSLTDYAYFTRTFAGIAKADARRLSDGRRELVHITIAGADDIPIDPASDLYRNLLAALTRLGDVGLTVQVEMREMVVLVLSAKVRLAPDYLWDPVVTEIRARLLDEFGFQKRALGQPALLCEFISVIQNTEGVAYVDVDALGGIPEKKTDKGTRRLLTLPEMANIVQEIVNAPSTFPKAARPLDRVNADIAGVEKGVLHPAQLAIFTPAVPDTLILNQIL